jgi:tetratricopeptide (TPR) repeat protein
MKEPDHIRELISEGNVDAAISLLDELVRDDKATIAKDEAYYLLGNAYRKKSNWQLAMNNYQAAIDLNPDSPAVEARKMVTDILDFFYKDMYNQ